jgi:hypothetical protein
LRGDRCCRRSTPVSSPSGRRSTVQQIRQEAIDISIDIASKVLQRNVSREDNERLIEETFKQFEATRGGR